MDPVEIDLGIMIDGFRALVWFQQHGEEVGQGGSCRECSRFAVALLRGRSPEEAAGLRCGTSQAMQRQVDDAFEIIRERTGSGA